MSPTNREERGPSWPERLTGLAAISVFGWLVVVLGVLEPTPPDLTLLGSAVAIPCLTLALAGFILDLVAPWITGHPRKWSRARLIEPLAAGGCVLALFVPSWVWSKLALADCVGLVFVGGAVATLVSIRWAERRTRVRSGP